MSEKLQAKEAAGLLAFVSEQLKDWSRNTIKQRLKTGCISVNGQPITQYDHELKAGDHVEVGASPKRVNSTADPLQILYKDRDLIAINKPAGLLSVASKQEKQHHALAILRNQLSSRSLSIKLWPVHRIDRDTSGVLLFATSLKMREAVMADWDNAQKTYLAIVEGCPNPDQGTINQPLRLDEKLYQMHVGPHPDAKSAITHFTTERCVDIKGGKRALLKVHLDTGRQHQIRAHVAWLGHPIIGDPRYGTEGKRMGLHALHLSITHPQTHQRLTFETPAPADFTVLLKG
jgi:23S rRNA pseudouridine1911/1915/1917 synthase